MNGNDGRLFQNYALPLLNDTCVAGAQVDAVAIVFS
jgi:hypothetical protein